MNNINKVFLKAGWMNIGDNIPVYFRYESADEYQKIPLFRIIYPVDKKGYVDLYEEAIRDRKMTIEQFEELLPNLIKSAFNHTLATVEVYHKVMIANIGDYYFWNEGFSNSEDAKQYENLFKLLNNATKKISKTTK